MSRSISIAGGKALAEALSQLPAKLEKQIMRAALRQGANVIKEQAKSNVPVRARQKGESWGGALRRSIRVTSDGRKKGQTVATVKAGNKTAYYYRFVEFGTALHFIQPKKAKALKFVGRDGATVITQKVLHSGAVAKPFMRPALDQKADEAINVVGMVIRSRLKEAIK